MKHPSITLRALLPLLFLALPALAATAPPLGIECAAEQGWGEKSQAADAALRPAEEARDWKKAIQSLRVMAGEQCDNAYLWMRLNIAYARAGQAREALELGAYVFGKFPNAVEGSLNFPEGEESMREVKALPGFAESAFGKNLAARYAERDARRRKAAATLAALPAAQRPPKNYVAKDACPFECCTFGEWSVDKKVELYAAPEGAPLGQSLKPGDKVEGLTGEVHLEPRPMLVGYPIEAETELGSDQHVKIPAGAIVFELDSLGEGFLRFWYQGQTFEAAQSSYCLVFDEECWNEPLDGGTEPWKHDWWVKVKYQGGKEAWARDEGFGNMDGCG